MACTLRIVKIGNHFFPWEKYIEKDMLIFINLGKSGDF